VAARQEAEAPRYRPLFELASGGMGVVYVAERREGRFRRLYAMKRLRPGADDESRRMFLEEARVAGMLRHPNVVPVTDYGSDAEGPFLIMDLVEGVSLQALLRASHDTNRHLPMQHVLAIGAAIADGLAAAHELRDETGRPLEVVHRDVSPQNVLIGFDGSVRLTDFGIARAATRNGESTQRGVIKGKLAYLSPEQLRFRRPDARSDLFAFGVVLFELATSDRLYAGEDGPTRILEEPVPNLRLAREDVDRELRDLVSSLLRKDPEKRPQRARDVAAKLHELHAAQIVANGRQELTGIIDALLPNARHDLRARVTEAERTETLAARAGRRLPLLALAATLLALAGVGASFAFSTPEDEDARNDVPAGPPVEVDEAAEVPAPVTAESPMAPEAEAVEPVETMQLRRRRRTRPRMRSTMRSDWSVYPE